MFCGSQGTFLPGELVLSHSLFARIFREQSKPANAKRSSDGETMTSHEKMQAQEMAVIAVWQVQCRLEVFCLYADFF